MGFALLIQACRPCGDAQAGYLGGRAATRETDGEAGSRRHLRILDRLKQLRQAADNVSAACALTGQCELPEN